jgi:DNA-binding XRE family transcriptional regulator
MATKWSELKAKMDPDRRVRMEQRARELVAQLPLHELRRAKEMTQATMAELLETSQSEVSKIEHRTDMYLSTLRKYVEAMGGELEIRAVFSDGAVRINQFEEKKAS